MCSGNDLLLLKELLNPNDNQEDEENCSNATSALGPADITTRKPLAKDLYKSPYDKLETEPKKGILQDPQEDSSFLEKFDDPNQSILNWKKTPEWNISYRQSVTPNDVFLQMGGKTPATASCEDMILKVELPGECRQNVNLKIEEKSLDLESPKFNLNIPLPQPVDPQRGNAEFDTTTQTLIITLKMQREFDFVNF